MKSGKLSLAIVGTLSLFVLGGCGTGSELNTSPNNVTASPSESTTKSDHTKSSKGGQVVESGKYHLEFVPQKEDSGTHLDFYLQTGDNHKAIPNAKVTAQIQLPDGTQKTIILAYDAEGKHYAALLSGTVAGEYQVKITADINGEKAEGRFSFNQ